MAHYPRRHIPTGETFPRHEGGEYRKTHCGFVLKPWEEASTRAKSDCEVCCGEHDRKQPASSNPQSPNHLGAHDDPKHSTLA